MKIHDAHVTSARFVRNCPDLSHSDSVCLYGRSRRSPLCAWQRSRTPSHTLALRLCPARQIPRIAPVRIPTRRIPQHSPIRRLHIPHAAVTGQNNHTSEHAAPLTHTLPTGARGKLPVRHTHASLARLVARKKRAAAKAACCCCC